jgi:hypothetical protein
MTYPNINDTAYGTTTSGVTWTLDRCSSVGIQCVVTDTRHMMRNTRWDQSTPTVTFDPVVAQQVVNFYSSLTMSQKNVLFGYYIDDEPAPSTINPSQRTYVRSWISYLKNYDNTRPSLVDLLPIYGFASMSEKPLKF